MPLTGSAPSLVGDDRSATAAVPVEVIVVAAGDRRCAFRLLDVDEVQRVVQITPLPGAQEPVEGVVDRRGAIVPVLDGRRRVGVPPRPVGLSDQLVFLRTPGRIVALRVDAVLGVAQVAPPTSPPTTTGGTQELPALGVVRIDDGLLVVFDIERFVSAEVSSTVDAALAALDVHAP